jgi:hypothetical protein
VIDALAGTRINVRHACRRLGVSESGYYAWRSRPASVRALRRIFLATEITDVHRDSGGVYGAHRVTAELRLGRQIIVGHNAVAQIMRELGIKGVPRRRLPRGARVGNVACEDLVQRRFARSSPDELWMMRHHRAPHQGRQGLLLCGHRCLLALHRRLGDRQHPDNRAGHKCARDGNPSAQRRGWPGNP